MLQILGARQYTAIDSTMLIQNQSNIQYITSTIELVLNYSE